MNKLLSSFVIASAVAMVGSPLSALAGVDFWWTGAAGDKKWSTPGNWANENEAVSTFLPTYATGNTVCWHDWDGIENDVRLDIDTEIAGFISYAGQISIDGNGHTLTVNGASGGQWAGNSFSQSVKFSGEGSKLVCKNGSFLISNGQNGNGCGLWAEDGAQISVSTAAPGVNARIKASNGGKVTLSSFEPKSTFVTRYEVCENGVLAVNGNFTLGTSGKEAKIILSGAKPAGGFVQVTAGALTLNNGVSISLSPELGWADNSAVGLIAYSGSKSASHVDSIKYDIDLANMSAMAHMTTNKICVLSNLKGTGTPAVPTSVSYNKHGDDQLDAWFGVEGKNLYLFVTRGHTWGGWGISKLPTRKLNGQKCRHCTYDGCTAMETKEIANSKLPGDFLMMDGIGYFETGYNPSYAKTHVEMKFQYVESPNAGGNALFWPKVGTEWGAVWWVNDSPAIQYYYEAGDFNLKSPFNDVRHAHTVRAFGKTAQFDDENPIVGVTEPPTAEMGNMLIGASVHWKTRLVQYKSKIKVYYVKIWEDSEAQPVHCYVPGMNGTQVTLFDLVTETYLNPKSGSGFTVGKDPSGLSITIR